MTNRKWLATKVNAAYERFVPSARSWHRLGHFITFSSAGFVAAASPEELLARHNYETMEIRRRQEGRRFGRSLEIGCGFGRLSPHLGHASTHHVAIDINRDALLAAERTYPGSCHCCSSATALPFADSSFDFISTWTVLQHIPPAYIEDALSEIVRVASPRAMFLLCEERVLADTNPRDEWHTHTWHRTPDYYAERLRPFDLRWHGPVTGMAAAQLQTPGEVMIFATDAKTAGPVAGSG